MRQNLNSNNVFIIQRKIVIFILIIIGIAISRNIVEEISTKAKLFNIFTLIPIALFFFVSYFINHKRMRFFQVVVIITVGILSTLFEKTIHGTGNIVVILGCLLLYRYGIITNMKKWHGLILFFVILMLNSFAMGAIESLSIVRSIVFSTINVFLLFAGLSMFKNDIDKYNEQAKRYEAYHRIGSHAIAALKDLNFSELADRVSDIVPFDALYEYPEAQEELKELVRLAALKDSFRQELLDSLRMDITTEPLLLDVCYAIKSFLNLHYVLSEIKEKIDIFPTQSTGISVFFVPHELYYLLHNIFEPIIRILMKEDEKNMLTITTTQAEEKVIINIFSTGPVISKLPPSDKEPIIDLSLNWCRSLEYYQFASAREMAHHLKGEIKFANRKEGGIEVLLKLPVYNEPSPVETGYYDDHYNWTP